MSETIKAIYNAQRVEISKAKFNNIYLHPFYDNCLYATATHSMSGKKLTKNINVIITVDESTLFVTSDDAAKMPLISISLEPKSKKIQEKIKYLVKKHNQQSTKQAP